MVKLDKPAIPKQIEVATDFVVSRARYFRDAVLRGRVREGFEKGPNKIHVARHASISKSPPTLTQEGMAHRQPARGSQRFGLNQMLVTVAEFVDCGRKRLRGHSGMPTNRSGRLPSTPETWQFPPPDAAAWPADVSVWPTGAAGQGRKKCRLGDMARPQPARDSLRPARAEGGSVQRGAAVAARFPFPYRSVCRRCSARAAPAAVGVLSGLVSRICSSTFVCASVASRARRISARISRCSCTAS